MDASGMYVPGQPITRKPKIKSWKNTLGARTGVQFSFWRRGWTYNAAKKTNDL